MVKRCRQVQTEVAQSTQRFQRHNELQKSLVIPHVRCNGSLAALATYCSIQTPAGDLRHCFARCCANIVGLEQGTLAKMIALVQSPDRSTVLDYQNLAFGDEKEGCPFFALLHDARVYLKAHLDTEL